MAGSAHPDPGSKIKDKDNKDKKDKKGKKKDKKGKKNKSDKKDKREIERRAEVSRLSSMCAQFEQYTSGPTPYVSPVPVPTSGPGMQNSGYPHTGLQAPGNFIH